MTELKRDTGDDRLARDSFFKEIGECINSWSIVEAQLETMLHRVTGMNIFMARKIFYSGTGFGARAQMVLAALKASTTVEPERMKCYLKFISRAKQYAGTRNDIVHGCIFYADIVGSKYFRQYYIVQGSKGLMHNPPDDEVITLENLKIAKENFDFLAQCLISAVFWDGKDPDKSPTRFLELEAQLANLAHSTRLDPSVSAKFSV